MAQNLMNTVQNAEAREASPERRAESDGYTVIRAMQETNPHCVAIVLTGYPACRVRSKAFTSESTITSLNRPMPMRLSRCLQKS